MKDTIKEMALPFLMLGAWFCIMVVVMIPSVYIYEGLMNVPNTNLLIWLKVLAILGYTLFACALIAIPCYKIFDWVVEHGS